MTKNIHKKYDLIQYAINVKLCGDENNDKQLLQIIKYRGCTKRLRNKLCLLLGIEVSKLQICCVDMNENGCNINIIHTIIKNNKSTSFILKMYENKYHAINQIITKIY